MCHSGSKILIERNFVHENLEQLMKNVKYQTITLVHCYSMHSAVAQTFSDSGFTMTLYLFLIKLHHMMTVQWEWSNVPLQILVDVVVAVVAGQSHQNASSTATLLLTTQTAVTHPAADGTWPSLQRKGPNLMWVTDSTTQVNSCWCFFNSLVWSISKSLLFLEMRRQVSNWKKTRHSTDRCLKTILQ